MFSSTLQPSQHGLGGFPSAFGSTVHKASKFTPTMLTSKKHPAHRHLFCTANASILACRIANIAAKRVRLGWPVHTRQLAIVLSDGTRKYLFQFGEVNVPLRRGCPLAQFDTRRAAKQNGKAGCLIHWSL